MARPSLFRAWEIVAQRSRDALGLIYSEVLPDVRQDLSQQQTHALEAETSARSAHAMHVRLRCVEHIRMTVAVLSIVALVRTPAADYASTVVNAVLKIRTALLILTIATGIDLIVAHYSLE